MSEDDERPKLRVVAANSQSQIETEYARDRLDYSLRNLAANVIRIVRGAGKSHELLSQCMDVIEAAEEYHSAASHLPTARELEAMLSITRPREDGDYFWRQRQDAVEQMISGSLRVAAGRLLQQSLQEDHGDKQLNDGFRYLEQLHAERRKEREDVERAARAAARAKPRSKSKAKNSRPTTKAKKDGHL